MIRISTPGAVLTPPGATLAEIGRVRPAIAWLLSSKGLVSLRVRGKTFFILLQLNDEDDLIMLEKHIDGDTRHW